MQRRRVERLGRMALQVAYWCQQADQQGWPLVFASRHGDLSRTYAMLQELAEGQPLSPTQFGLSTHNAIAAQYTLARSMPANYLAVSAGIASPEAALTEASSLIADGAANVLVVMYDGHIPEPYSTFLDEPHCEYAWAWAVTAASSQLPNFSLECSALDAPSAAEPLLPHGLDVLRFMLSSDASLVLADAPRHWRWTRDA